MVEVNRKKISAVLAACAVSYVAGKYDFFGVVWQGLTGIWPQLDGKQAEVTLVVALLSQSVAIVLALLSMRRTRNTSILGKTVDVSIHCTQRYEKLQQSKTEIVKLKGTTIGIESEKESPAWAEIEHLEKNYEGSFWALKSDQFDFWLIGTLDHDTFFDWSYYLAVKYAKEKQPPSESKEHEEGRTLAERWQEWRGQDGSLSHGGSNPQFVSFIDSLLALTERHVRNKVNDDRMLAMGVLDLMKALEGPNGFSRRYRRLAWRGFRFTDYYKLMVEDLKVK